MYLQGMLNGFTQEVPWGLTECRCVFTAGFLKQNCLILSKFLINLPHTHVPELKANTTERKQYP